MSATQTKDWNPEAYDRFRGFRLRPALDLLAQVPDLPQGDIVDLGCGNGAVGQALRARWPEQDRDIVGVDTSPSMLSEAECLKDPAGGPLYDALTQEDIALWSPDRRPALIFSNAVLHWLPDHAVLMPRLVESLVPCGVLAVQMPRQFMAPSHRLLWTVAGRLYPDRFGTGVPPPPVAAPASYARIFDGLGQVSVWETEYFQRLAPVEVGHPVRHFTQSTAMRPILATLSEEEAQPFIASYDAELLMAYPLENDGSVLFPFRRLFFTVQCDT